MECLNSTKCPSLETFQEAYTYFALFISALGIFLNVICLSVLVHPELDSVFNRIRILLASFDLGYLVSDAVYKVTKFQVPSCMVPSCMDLDDKLTENISLILLSILSSGSAYTTVALAVERCFSILYPVTNHHNNLNRSSRTRAFAKYLFPVIFFSLLHNIATITESKISESSESIESSKNSTFKAYTSEYQKFVIILTILRLVFYISINLYIFLFNQSFQKRSTTIRNDNQQAFILQMLIISLSSIILHIFWIVYLIKGQFKDEKAPSVCRGLGKGETIGIKVLLNVTDIFWLANSACNFFIYSFIGVKFRKVLLKLYLKKDVLQQEQDVAEKDGIEKDVIENDAKMKDVKE